MKAKTNAKARPISDVGSAEADSVLLELGFLQDDGNEVGSHCCTSWSINEPLI